VARLVAYLATGGRQGVLGALDLAVLPLSVPGQGVRVMPGAGVILNRALNAVSDSYVVRMPSQDTVTTVANGPGSVRSDLVIARIENPFISGEPWSTPVDVTTGPYIFTRILQGVPAGTKSVDVLGLGYSAIPLARIDFPISTATVTAGMIKDLRSVVNPAALTPVPAPDADGETGDIERNYIYVLCPSTGVAETGGDLHLASHTAFHDWPIAATWTVTFPKWCTHVEFDLRVNNVQVNDADAWGEIQLLVNGVSAKVMVYDFNMQVAGNGIRQIMCLGGEYLVPPSLRGKTVTCKIQAKSYVDPRVTGCIIRANASCYTSGHMHFHAKPVLS
jgi:hypothetical protein